MALTDGCTDRPMAAVRRHRLPVLERRENPSEPERFRGKEAPLPGGERRAAYRVVSRRRTVAVRPGVTYRSVSRADRGGFRYAESGIPAQRTELIGREVVPVVRIIPDAANGLGRLEDQAIAAARSRDIRRRDFIDAPIGSQRVDEAKARVSHPAFDSFWWASRQPATTASTGFATQKQVNTRASAVRDGCFEFHALNSSSTGLPANTT